MPKAPILESVAAVTLIGLAVAVIHLFLPKFSLGDLATWLGAIGTCLAFGGTIWLTTSQNRAQKKTAEELAHLAAARISGELASLIDRIDMAVAQLVFGDPTKLGPNFARQVIDLIPYTEGGIGQTEQLALLSPLPGRAAHRIARAVGMIRGLATALEPYTNPLRWERVTDAGREHYSAKWQNVLQQVIDLLKIAQGECVKAAEIGAPLPTHEEIYGPWINDLEDF